MKRLAVFLTSLIFFTMASAQEPVSQESDKKEPDGGKTVIQKLVIETKEPIPIVEKKAAPPSEISGIIQEKGTRRPLKKAAFFIKELNKEIRTDKEGKFKFTLEKGKYTVSIPVVGYEKFETEIDVRENENMILTFRIEPLVINPYQIIVREKKDKGEVSTQRISIQEATSIPGTNRDVLKVITNMPGVNSISVFNGFGSGLIIRGSAPEDSIYRVDDQWVPLMYHFGGLESIIEPELVESVDFYAGGYPPEFVDGLGGVVKINLRDPRTDRWGGFANLSFLSTSVMVEGPITDRDSIAFTVKRGFIDLYIMLLNSFGILAGADFITYPYYYDASAIYTHLFSKNNKLKIFAVGSIDGTELTTKNDSESPRVANQFSLQTKFIQLIGEWHYKKDAIESTLSPAIGLTNFHIDMGDRAYMTMTNFQTSLYEKLSYKISDTNTITGGLRFVSGFYDMNADLFAPPKEGEISYNPFANETIDKTRQGYAIPSFHVLETITEGNWIFAPGLAGIIDTRNTHMFLDPRLSVKYKLTDTWTLKAATGMYSSTPSDDESARNWGTPGLAPEHSVHVIAGVEKKITDNIDLDIQGYYKYFYDMIVRIDPNNPTKYGNEGLGYAYGAEFLLRHKMTDNFFGWISYSYSISRRKDFLGPNGSAPQWRAFDMDINHNLIAVASYKFNKYWQLGAKFSLQSGTPYTNLQNSPTLYDFVNDVYSPLYSGPINPDRMPVRHQLDLRLDKYWLFDSWILSTYLDVQNVYYQKNAVGYAYNNDYTQKEKITLLPIMIYIGFKGDF